MHLCLDIDGIHLEWLSVPASFGESDPPRKEIRVLVSKTLPFVFVSGCIYIHTHTRKYTCVYVHTHTHIHTYTCLCVYIHKHAYTCVCVCMYTNIIYMFLVMSDSVWPCGLWPTRLLCPWNSPGKNTGVGSCFLFQGIFPTQGWNPGLLHCRQILYHLSHSKLSFIK